jgi:UbiD family decarboxylase
MPSLSNLREFLAALRNEGDLVEINAPADPILEIPEIHRRVISAGGPALLFKNPKGSSFPVVTNLYGTRKRVELAFGKKPLEFVREVARLALLGQPPKLGDLWNSKGLLFQALKLRSRKVRSGPVFEAVQEPPRLSQLPHLKLWPEDGGRFVTLGHVLTRSPNGGPPNLGVYRMQVYDDRTTGMHWQIGKGGGFHYSVAKSQGLALPVSVFLGGPPALLLSAIAPLPEGVPEILLVGLLQDRRLSVREDTRSLPNASLSCKGTWRPVERIPKDPSAIITGTTPSSTIIPYSNASGFVIGRTPSIPRPLSANRGKKILTLGITSRNC